MLEASSSVQHRRIASDAIGYIRQCRAQILALIRAARDPDDEVRNNATRALGVLVRSISRFFFFASLNSTRPFHPYAQFGHLERSEQRRLAPDGIDSREESRSTLEDTFSGRIL